MKKRKQVYWLLYSSCVSKGKFIKMKGRAAWDNVPKRAVVKDGKRAYITQEAFLDNVWLVPHATP